MIKRIITGTISMILLALVAVCYETVVFPAVIAFFAATCVYETFTALRVRSRAYIILCVLLTAAEVFLAEYAPVYVLFVMVVMLLITVVFSVLFYETLKMDVMLSALSMLLFVSSAASAATFFVGVSPVTAPFYLLLIAVCGWVSDMGAYFVGTFFGKHRLAPVISPKKTVEGLVGGVFFACIGTVLLTFVYRALVNQNGYTVEYDLWRLFVCALLATLAGVIGDLFASVIKRAHDLKDFGSLFPGHGGAMDRFDSILMSGLVVFVAALYFPLFTITQVAA